MYFYWCKAEKLSRYGNMSTQDVTIQRDMNCCFSYKLKPVYSRKYQSKFSVQTQEICFICKLLKTISKLKNVLTKTAMRLKPLSPIRIGKPGSNGKRLKTLKKNLQDGRTSLRTRVDIKPNYQLSWSYEWINIPRALAIQFALAWV